MRKFVLLPIIIAFLAGLAAVSSAVAAKNTDERKQTMTGKTEIDSMIILYDNNPYQENLQTAWGFSCLIRGLDKTILFDTGGDGDILLKNMERLNVDPRDIDVIFLSHEHGDHTGGLRRILDANSNVTVFMLRSFPAELKNIVAGSGARLVEIGEPQQIIPDVYSSGDMGSRIHEQGLFIKSSQGIIIITGCAHPGITRIVEKAKGLLKDEIRLVLGGFHLGAKNRQDISGIVCDFRILGVEHVGPTHCSGDDARNEFEKEYGISYIRCGVGRVIRNADF